MKPSVKYWTERYKNLTQKRDSLWKSLKEEDIKEEWISQRVTKHQWSIDEVLRHLLASDVRYIQQPLNPEIEQHKYFVRAQWVGKIFFRFEEKEHIPLRDIIEAFNGIGKKSSEILENLQSKDLDKQVEAPWKQMVPYEFLIEHSIDHELTHHGQIYFMLTYHRGPPEFESTWEEYQAKVKKS